MDDFKTITIKVIVKAGIQLSRKFNIFLAIFFIVAYFLIFQQNFTCSCKGQAFQCAAFFSLPCLVLLIFILWTDRPFQREWRYASTCSRSKCNTFVLSLFTHSLKALLVGLLWAEAVLLDGYWYVCCLNDGSKQQVQLACSDSHTSEEKDMIAQLKSSSRAWGFGLLTVIGLLTVVWFSFDWERIFSTCWGNRINVKIQLHRLFLEESETFLAEKLREAAKKKISQKVTQYVNEERWERCLDVADELIKESSEQREDEASPPKTETRSEDVDQGQDQDQDQDQPGTSSEESNLIP